MYSLEAKLLQNFLDNCHIGSTSPLSAAESLIPWLTHTGAPGMFPQPCTRMAIVSMTTSTGIINVAYGLTEYFRFYANDIEVSELILLMTTR